MTIAPLSETAPDPSAAELLDLLLPARARFGITRLAEITRLDRIGVPVWQAIRPNARSLSVSQGKGATDDDAKVSALLESLESYHAEHAACPLRIESFDELSRRRRVVDPERLPRARLGTYAPHTPLPWAEARDLATDEPVYVPFELVHSNFTLPRVPGNGAFVASSNGMGAGATRARAALHAICELVERDAEALFEQGGDALRASRRVALETIDGPASTEILARLRDAGLEVMVWELTSDVRLPCFSTVIFELAADPHFYPRPAAEGSGCHPSRDGALCRALLEAAQSRLTPIAGSRDDFSRSRYADLQSAVSLDHWRAESARPAVRGFDEAPDAVQVSSAAALRLAVDRLAERGLSEVAYVDLSSAELALTFLRVVVPGLEGSSASPSYQPGARARAAAGLAARHAGPAVVSRTSDAARRVVFLGPSLPRSRVPGGLDVRPPVAQGDVLSALEEGATELGIIDGYFDHVPSVWHKEILLALERGVVVYGAASMGALRAAELHGFGMIGVGRIFELYRDGVLVGDDEVAVLHAPEEAGYRTIAEALVNLRDRTDHAVALGIVGRPEAEALLAALKALPYTERSVQRVAELGGSEALVAFLRAPHESLKERDAAALVSRMASAPGAPPPRRERVERSVFFERLRLDVRLRASDGSEACGDERALLELLAEEHAILRGVPPTADEVEAALRELERDPRGEGGLDAAASLALARRRAAVRKLLALYGPELARRPSTF